MFPASEHQLKLGAGLLIKKTKRTSDGLRAYDMENLSDIRTLIYLSMRRGNAKMIENYGTLEELQAMEKQLLAEQMPSNFDL